jgi:Zn-dependent M16 (insulinase) family peptidase
MHCHGVRYYIIDSSFQPLVIPVVISALQLADIPKTITKVPTALSELNGGAKLLAHELFTNDVLYAEAALDMSGLPASLLPLVPLFCRSLTQVGIQQSHLLHQHCSCWPGCHVWGI